MVLRKHKELRVDEYGGNCMTTKIFTDERLAELEELPKDFLTTHSFVIHKEMNPLIVELFEKCNQLEDKIDNLN